MYVLEDLTRGIGYKFDLTKDQVRIYIYIYIYICIEGSPGKGGVKE